MQRNVRNSLKVDENLNSIRSTLNISLPMRFTCVQLTFTRCILKYMLVGICLAMWNFVRASLLRCTIMYSCHTPPVRPEREHVSTPLSRFIFLLQARSRCRVVGRLTIHIDFLRIFTQIMSRHIHTHTHTLMPVI